MIGIVERVKFLNIVGCFLLGLLEIFGSEGCFGNIVGMYWVDLVNMRIFWLILKRLFDWIK